MELGNVGIIAGDLEEDLYYFLLTWIALLININERVVTWQVNLCD